MKLNLKQLVNVDEETLNTTTISKKKRMQRLYRLKLK